MKGTLIFAAVRLCIIATGVYHLSDDSVHPRVRSLLTVLLIFLAGLFHPKRVLMRDLNSGHRLTPDAVQSMLLLLLVGALLSLHLVGLSRLDLLQPRVGMFGLTLILVLAFSRLLYYVFPGFAFIPDR